MPRSASKRLTANRSSRKHGPVLTGLGLDRHAHRDAGGVEAVDTHEPRLFEQDRAIVGCSEASSTALRTASMAASISTCGGKVMSRVPSDQLRLRLPTRMMVPFGTHHRVPSAPLTRVILQVDRFNGSGGQRRAEVDAVADAALIVEQHEEAGDAVLDQRLCAEAQGDAGNTGAGDQWREVDVEQAEDDEYRDGPDDRRHDASGHRRQRRGADDVAVVTWARGPPSSRRRSCPALGRRAVARR